MNELEYGSREWCLNEVMKVIQKLEESPQLPYRNWMECLEDRRFGPELGFILNRAFDGEKNFTYDHGCLSPCLSMGRREGVMQKARPSLSVFTASEGAPNLYQLFPFRWNFTEAITGVKKEAAATFDFVARDLWCISKCDGAWRLGRGCVINNFDKDLQPWPVSMAAGDGGLGWSPFDERSAEEKEETGNFLVIATLGVVDKTHYVRIHFDVIKPPKNSAGQ